MAEQTNIGWTGSTWNFVRARNRATGAVGWHCEKESEACRRCYAQGFNRFRGTGLPYKPGHRDDVEIFLDEAMLLKPLRWHKPRAVFPCSMTDLFADFVPDPWLDRAFAVMALATRHSFTPLTKRSARLRAYLADRATPGRVWTAAGDLADLRPALAFHGAAWGGEEPWPLRNVCPGVTAEDQGCADARIPDLLAAPAATRFVSAEPLLGRIDFRRIRLPGGAGTLDALAGGLISQIVVGGENGPGCRPLHPQWARDVLGQCAGNGAGFYFKQWGAWKPISEMPEPEFSALYRPKRVARDGEDQAQLDDVYGRRCTVPVETLGYGGATGHDAFIQVDGRGGMTFFRVGRDKAGRTLDGALHDAMPRYAA